MHQIPLLFLRIKLKKAVSGMMDRRDLILSAMSTICHLLCSPYFSMQWIPHTFEHATNPPCIGTSITIICNLYHPQLLTVANLQIMQPSHTSRRAAEVADTEVVDAYPPSKALPLPLPEHRPLEHRPPEHRLPVHHPTVHRLPKHHVMSRFLIR